jgi:ACR3 family arsenite efflux pump ArsB
MFFVSFFMSYKSNSITSRQLHCPLPPASNNFELAIAVAAASIGIVQTKHLQPL